MNLYIEIKFKYIWGSGKLGNAMIVLNMPLLAFSYNINIYIIHLETFLYSNNV